MPIHIFVEATNDDALIRNWENPPNKIDTLLVAGGIECCHYVTHSVSSSVLSDRSHY